LLSIIKLKVYVDISSAYFISKTTEENVMKFGFGGGRGGVYSKSCWAILIVVCVSPV